MTVIFRSMADSVLNFWNLLTDPV